MSAIATDKLTYFHKGLLRNKWKECLFTFYSNGMLVKINDGKIRRAVDLKAVVNRIRVKSVLDYDLEARDAHMLAQGSSLTTALGLKYKKSSVELPSTQPQPQLQPQQPVSATRMPLNAELFDNVDLTSLHGIDLRQAMLMVLPLYEDSKKTWIFLFPDFEKLSFWITNIKKWASIPKIQINFVNVCGEEEENEVETSENESNASPPSDTTSSLTSSSAVVTVLSRTGGNASAEPRKLSAST